MNTYLKNFLSVLVVVALHICDRVASAQVLSARDTNIVKLELGKPVEREMRAGEIHAYYVSLVTGQFLRATIDQRGIDVIVTVFDPDGKKIFEIDSPNGTQGPEPVDIEASSSGAYRLEVKPLEQEVKPGRYEARIEKILSPEENAERLAEERANYEIVKNWIRDNAISLKTVEAGHGFADLQPLKKLIGSSRIVALGEATHGTREFFQLKHRMLEFLVNEMGFTVFAIEASMPEAFDINEYVLTGSGDPEKALTGLRSWDTEEMLDMIRWMRRHNEDDRHPNKVKFYGFHTAGTPLATKRVLEYLQKVDPEQASIIANEMDVLNDPFLMDHLRSHSNWVNNFQHLPNEKKEKTVELAKMLLRCFDEQRREYMERSSRTDWELARQYAVHIVQNLTWRTSPFTLNGKVRDSLMAETVQWILDREGPDAKMVVWAHNGHVATISMDWGYRSMGWHLRKRFGKDLIICGLLFNQGSFQSTDFRQPAGGRHPFTVGPAHEGAFEATLAAAGLSLAALNLRDIPEDGPLAAWMNAPHATRDIGSFYSEGPMSGFLINQMLTSQYDVIFFVESTTALRDNESYKRPPTEILDAPTNLDFESGETERAPPGWVLPTGLASVNFRVVTSAEHPRSGRQCAVIKRVPGELYGEIEGSLRQMIDATSYREKRIKLRAWVRVEARDRYDKAYLWLRVLTQDDNLLTETFYENMADRPITSNEWRAYEITAAVPAAAVIIEYGLAFVGDGQAYLDAVSLEEIQK
jgi:erythromycin esterase